MSDKYCQQCSECGDNFHTFKRKQLNYFIIIIFYTSFLFLFYYLLFIIYYLLILYSHCRLCGRVFCHTCCSERISGEIFDSLVLIRVCILCSKLKLNEHLYGIGTYYSNFPDRNFSLNMLNSPSCNSIKDSSKIITNQYKNFSKEFIGKNI